MELVTKANDYANSLIMASVIVIAIAGFLAYYFVKVKKIASKEEHINYETFRRKDAIEYIKFDDIVSIGAPDDKSSMGVMALGENIFIGGIDVVGYNYRSASADERKSTMANSIAFMNIIEDQIQMRQTCKAIDIEHNINIQDEKVKDINRELLELSSDYQATVELAENYMDDPDAYEAIAKRLKILQKTITSKRWQYEEAQEVLIYMRQVSSASNNTKRINQIMFSYEYNPNDYMEELSDAEIRIKAIQELSIRAEAYSAALENCGCSCRPLTVYELTELNRRHYHPRTADKVRISDLLNSSYSALYITSDSLYELEKERIGDEAFAREMAAFEEKEKKILKETEEKRKMEVGNLEAEIKRSSGDMTNGFIVG